MLGNARWRLVEHVNSVQSARMKDNGKYQSYMYGSSYDMRYDFVSVQPSALTIGMSCQIFLVSLNIQSLLAQARMCAMHSMCP